MGLRSTSAASTRGTTTITTTSTASTTWTSPPPAEGTSIITPARTVSPSVARSTTTSRIPTRSGMTSMTAPAESSSLATKAPTSHITSSIAYPSTTTTNAGTIGFTSTTALPRAGTTITTTTSTASTTRTSPSPMEEITTTTSARVPTSGVSSSSTSMTTTGVTTTFTSGPSETSSLATEAPTSHITASSHHPSATVTVFSTHIPATSVSSTALSTATIPRISSTTSIPVTTSGTPQSSHVPRSTSPIFSSTSSTPVTTEASTFVSSIGTTPCFCHVFGNLFSPGEVIYNTTDGAGCNFYALCSKECEIDPYQGPCPSTTPFTSRQATSSTEHGFSSVSPTTATFITTSGARNCTDVDPPRQPEEHWISECQKCFCDPVTATAQCQPILCPTSQTPVCDLGFTSVPVLPPKDSCCPEYHCKPIDGICVINGTTYTVRTL
ncbi:uncharacterized protein PRD47_008245 isoform 1-T2 [Ara ararauna]